MARVVETAIIVSMSLHLYCFDDEIYLQSSGGPIGMRATASLANVIMKIYDQAWVKLMEREGVIMDLFVRYVDDCRIFLTAINEGWRWEGNNFVFDWQWREEDIASGETDSERTTRHLARAICSMVPFLKFTGEECGMFKENILPTLDTKIWCEGEKTKYSFYEKPQVPNRVLMKGTALPESTVRSSLLQEVVRRMEHSNAEIQDRTRSDILSSFAQKMINSGHSKKSTRLTLVHGVLKYRENVILDQLPKEHSQHRPMYLYKRYNEAERQREKCAAKTSWYGEKAGVKRKLRDKLCGTWRGAKQLQRKIKSMPYTTVMQVPSSKGSRLMNRLVKQEPKIAKMTGYQTKITEKSGVQLARLFMRVTAPNVCDWENCGVCNSGGRRCRQQNVVYRAVCSLCEREVEEKTRAEEKKGLYIGETGRSLAERSSEHLKKLENCERDNFILRHWALEHPLEESPPAIQFRIVKNHRDCLSRLLHEAVLIDQEGTMNGKSEWRLNRRPKLTVELVGKDKERKKIKEIKEEKEEDDLVDKVVYKMERLKERSKRERSPKEVDRSKEKKGEKIKKQIENGGVKERKRKIEEGESSERNFNSNIKRVKVQTETFGEEIDITDYKGLERCGENKRREEDKKTLRGWGIKRMKERREITPVERMSTQKKRKRNIEVLEEREGRG